MHPRLATAVDAAVDRAAQIRYHRRYRAIRHDLLQPFLDADAVFVHIPKTAGVSVTTAFFDADSPGSHMTAEALRRILGWRRWQEMFTFAIVREPLERLASAYRYLSDGGRGTRDDLAAGRLLEGCSSLDEFAGDWLARRDVQAFPHFRPQWPFVCDRHGRVIVDHIGRLEQLSDALEVINERLGREVEVPRLNRSGGSVDLGLSAEACRAAVAFYRRDYELLDYPMPTCGS